MDLYEKDIQKLFHITQASLMGGEAIGVFNVNSKLDRIELARTDNKNEDVYISITVNGVDGNPILSQEITN